MKDQTNHYPKGVLKMKKFMVILTKIALTAAAGILWVGSMIAMTVGAVWAGIRDVLDGYSARTVLRTFVDACTEISKGIWDELKETFVTIDKEIGA
jgi:hypothetical protein